MNILIYNAYYPPEIASSMFLATDIAKGFASAGNNVRMFVPVPCRGISNEVRKKYKKIKEEYQCNGSLRINRYPLIAEGKNPVLRAVRYFLQNTKQYRRGKHCLDTDVIFSGSTPPTQGFMCSLVKKKLIKKTGHYIPFVYNLQDIFPDSLVNGGLARKNSLLWKIGRKIEEYTYKNADKIIVISESFKRNIMEKGVPEDKISVVSNWIDLDSVKPIPKSENKLYDEFNIDRNKFTVVYAGNFGAAQGADIIIKAAEIIKNEPGIQFVIFGGGSNYEAVRQEITAKALNNVIINSLLPQDRVSEVYSLGDLALITCKAGFGNSGMPSKTWSIMACDVPILASFDKDSELSDILNKTGCGICTEPGNADELAMSIIDYYHKRDTVNKVSGRLYVNEYASKEKCVPQYIGTLIEAQKTKEAKITV